MTDTPDKMVATEGGPAIAACVFDAYGTLFDVASPTRRLEGRIGPKAAELSVLWRTRQTEYTWLRSLMDRYADFWQVTGESLDFAMAAIGLDDPSLRARLMELYLTLDAYPDVAPMLDVLRGRGVRTAILSNGSPTMLTAAVSHAGLRDRLDVVMTVDAAQIYKPHPAVYQMACDRFKLPAERIAFVSSNGWDVAGASTFGFRTVWLNRVGNPRERLPGTPIAEIQGLDTLPEVIAGVRP